MVRDLSKLRTVKQARSWLKANLRDVQYRSAAVVGSIIAAGKKICEGEFARIDAQGTDRSITLFWSTPEGYGIVLRLEYLADGNIFPTIWEPSEEGIEELGVDADIMLHRIEMLKQKVNAILNKSGAKTVRQMQRKGN